MTGEWTVLIIPFTLTKDDNDIKKKCNKLISKKNPILEILYPNLRQNQIYYCIS